MAFYTEVIVCLDLMFAAYAYSPFRKEMVWLMASFGGITNVTIEVPLLN